MKLSLESYPQLSVNQLKQDVFNFLKNNFCLEIGVSDPFDFALGVGGRGAPDENHVAHPDCPAVAGLIFKRGT